MALGAHVGCGPRIRGPPGSCGLMNAQSRNRAVRRVRDPSTLSVKDDVTRSYANSDRFEHTAIHLQILLNILVISTNKISLPRCESLSMSDPDIIDVISEPDVHDGTILKVHHIGATTRVLVKTYDGPSRSDDSFLPTGQKTRVCSK